ncbi:MAG: enoyl-CoA hydratase/isomerase family protein, partial [Limnobacter sp.]|nr:enoyl-CoA hydratase/isomerase family protein [Limnobacter sp.]
MTSTTSKVVLEHTGHGVATLTLNRPEVKNALNGALIAALTEAFIRLGQEESVRVVVLQAEGDAFCSGADLAWLQQAATENEHSVQSG